MKKTGLETATGEVIKGPGRYISISYSYGSY